MKELRSSHAKLSQDPDTFEHAARAKEKLDMEDLQRCQTAFDTLDADASGELDMEDVVAARAAAGASSSVGVGGAAPVPPAP